MNVSVAAVADEPELSIQQACFLDQRIEVKLFMVSSKLFFHGYMIINGIAIVFVQIIHKYK